MSGRSLRQIALVAAFVGLSIAGALAGPMKSSFATVGGETKIPYGWVDFCGRQPQECDQPKLEPQALAVTRASWAQLQTINRKVNAEIEPVSNLEHWGTLADHWDYPTDGKGDCKIYALQKRRLLIEKGFPRQALLMTIVLDHQGMGHTILTAHTDKGDFILDNLTDKVLPWSETGYRFLKRQSQEDPNIWLAFLPQNDNLRAEITGPTGVSEVARTVEESSAARPASLWALAGAAQ